MHPPAPSTSAPQPDLPPADDGPGQRANITVVEGLIAAENEALLRHRYFEMCRSRAISRAHTLEIVKRMCCFSTMFERLLTGRLAQYSANKDPGILQVARRHLREELGHPDLFHECLRQNGVPASEVTGTVPGVFMKSMFGYLLATIQYESEYVANVALMQVMESIALLVFGATLPLLQAHELVATALQQHTDDDEAHARMGLELVAACDEQTMKGCRRAIADLYHLMGLVLDEFIALATPAH